MRCFSFWLLAVALLSMSCGSVQDSVSGTEQVVLPAEGIEIERDLVSGVPPEVVPLLEAIRLALETGDEANARRSLFLLMQRDPVGRTLQIAEGFERILDGRHRIGWMDLVLETVEGDGAPGVFHLELSISQHGPEDLRLRLGGVRLKVYQYAVDPDGRERRSTRRDGVPFPKELILKRGAEPLRLPVADLEMSAPADILAISYLFTLEFLPGEFVMDDGRFLPVQNIPTPELELVRLAKELPNSAVAPSELVSYVERGRIFVPALLERAVRIQPAQREEALDLLTPVVDRMNSVEFELLVPALRWLSRSVRPGGDPEAWKSWLDLRSRKNLEAAEPDWDGLRLPGR